ncbi:right-handed parallel beta-helix repeat-containing protein [Sutcliffiella horikoshii]|uniref:right-handed parallel beta-helix repeat-containing protein n=1 Tax=Sutcliffiella horikoshii TaxID=79883 RepID=UPI00384B1190
MASRIQIKSCLKSDLPKLSVGEFAICTDTREVFIGTENENLQIADKQDIGILEELQTTNKFSLVNAVNEVLNIFNNYKDEIISPSSINGNVIVNGKELTVFDDSSINNLLSLKSPTDHTHAIQDIEDFAINNPKDGEVLVYDSINMKFITRQLSGHESELKSLGDLTDVNLTDYLADNGDFLFFMDGQWVPTSTSSYIINLEFWGINNNGIEPLTTTIGINNALQWASAKGYTKCKLPKGVYLINKDTAINMVSNMTLDLYGCILKKESNGNQKYYIINIENSENITILGGVIQGERFEHDYTTTPGTHEWGTGININNSKHINIKNVEILETTGYGIFIGALYKQIYTLNKSALEQGTFNNNGSLLNENDWVRSSTFFDLSNQNIQNQGYFMICGNGYGTYGVGNDISKETINIYFYDNENNFISSIKTRTFEEVFLKTIPPNSKKFKLSYRRKLSEIQNCLIEIRTDIPSKWITITNCFIHSCRALGIVGGGGQNITIENCEISNIGGTAPACGIDIEDGYSINQNITIRNNYFHDNLVADIIVISARNVLIEMNKFNNSVDFGGPRGENYVSQYNRYNLSSGIGKTLAGDNGTYCVFRYDHFTEAQLFLSGNALYENCIFDNINFILQSDLYLTTKFSNCKFNFNKPDVGWSWILRRGSLIFRYCEFNVKCKWYYFRSEAHLGDWERNNLVFEHNIFNTSTSLGEMVFETGQLTMVNNILKGSTDQSTYYSFRAKSNKVFFTGNNVKDVYFVIEGKGIDSQAIISDNKVNIDNISPVLGFDRSEFLYLYWFDKININNNIFDILQANITIRCLTIYAEKRLNLTGNLFSCNNGNKAKIDLIGALRNSNNQSTIHPLKSVIKNNIFDNVSLNQDPTYTNQLNYQVLDLNVDFNS